ncbi:MAG: hypothetical protein WAV47_17025 [Blastocatellia bacterium]
MNAATRQLVSIIRSWNLGFVAAVLVAYATSYRSVALSRNRERDQEDRAAGKQICDRRWVRPGFTLSQKFDEIKHDIAIEDSRFMKPA